MERHDNSRTHWRVSRYSSLVYGVMIDDVLPSRGPDQCVFAARCPLAFKTRCSAGGRCAQESYTLSRYISSATAQYAYARTWLDQDEFDLIIRSMAIVSLQLSRLSARIANEGPFDGGGATGYVQNAGIAITRYATALHQRQKALIRRLLDSDTVEYWDKV